MQFFLTNIINQLTLFTITRNISFNLSLNNNVLDKSLDNLISFAKMCKTAYDTDPKPGEYNGIPLNNTQTIDPQKNTIHGFVFQSVDKKYTVIAFKGTSLGISNSSYNDKFNDNLLFNKNPFQLDPYRYPCVCLPKTTECIDYCFKESFKYPLNYLRIAEQYFKDLKTHLDLSNTQIFSIGHSLGGILATFIGMKYNQQVVTFNAPGEYFYLNKVFDFQDPPTDKVLHFGHNLDPVFNGNCNNAFQWCRTFGYHLETYKHYGQVLNITLTGRESIFTHRLTFTISLLQQLNSPDLIFQT